MEETPRTVFFEGGEPFLFYPLMTEGIRMASERGLSVGVVTNAYFATAEEDARLWLEPLTKIGLADLSISDDEFHSSGEAESPARIALASAESLEMPSSSICIEQPKPSEVETGKGEPVLSGGAKIRGRAADTLIEDLPRHPGTSFTECHHEELRDPKRVHLDPFGLLHMCQGLAMGNIWETPLKKLLDTYDPDSHPIAGPLLRGGPAALAREHGVEPDEGGYADECHFCYLTRKSLVEKFPDVLAPPQVYGLE